MNKDYLHKMPIKIKLLNVLPIFLLSILSLQLDAQATAIFKTEAESPTTFMLDATTSIDATKNTGSTIRAALLWDNTDINHINTGIISTDLTSVVPSGLANTADDFIVPEGLIWTIEEFSSTGFSNNTSATDGFTIVIYKYADGKPGAEVYSESTALITDVWVQNIVLTNPPVLDGGRYFISIFGNYNTAATLSDARWNWRTGSTAIEYDWALQDVAGFFGGLSWTPATDLAITEVSCVFALYGTSETDMTIPVSDWGVYLGAFLIFLFMALGSFRKLF